MSLWRVPRQPDHLADGQVALVAEHLVGADALGAGYVQYAVMSSARLTTVIRRTSIDPPSGRLCR